MATSTGWNAAFDRQRRYKLFLTHTWNAARQAVWLCEFAISPNCKSPSTFDCLRQWGRLSCICGWGWLLLAEAVAYLCRNRSSSKVDLFMVFVTPFIMTIHFALAIAVNLWTAHDNGVTLIVIGGLDCWYTLVQSFLDWYFAAVTDVAPCRFACSMDGQRKDLVVWYKMGLCKSAPATVSDDCPVQPVALPETTPLPNFESLPEWMKTKIREET